MRRRFVGGNWKMHIDLTGARTLSGAVEARVRGAAERADVAVFPPFPYILPVGDLLRSVKSPVLLGAQDFYPAPSGPFTGEVSLDMLLDCGVSVVLAGHSERRHVLGETNDIVNAKVRAALERSGLICVLCIGEKLDQRAAGETDAVNERQLRTGLQGVPRAQLSRLVIAYEPVWAIGTGKTATPDDARAAHQGIRRVLESLFDSSVAESTRVIYGGSVNAANARDLFAQPGVDGGLIGGASLKAEEFCRIVLAAAEV
jgi:triosephosphate isomerase